MNALKVLPFVPVRTRKSGRVRVLPNQLSLIPLLSEREQQALIQK